MLKPSSSARGFNPDNRFHWQLLIKAVQYLIDIHVDVNGDSSVREGHEIAHRVKDALLASHQRFADVLVHVEPHET